MAGARAGAIAAGAVALAFAAAAASCDRHGRGAEAVDPALVEIDVASTQVLSGTIGVGRRATDAAYVLVDARSHAAFDVYAAIEGDLLDAAGQPIGHLDVESLRVPAGARRTFALVHHDGPVPGAAAAAVRLGGVTRAEHPDPVEVVEGHVYQDGERVVAAAYVANRAERLVKVVVIASFYDGAGKILSRPFTTLDVVAGDRRPVQFVGPPGSAQASIFLGDELF